MDASAAAVALLLKGSGLEIESEVRGSSMRPALTHGSRIRIHCGPARCAPGEIVAILADPLVAHRVVGCVRYRSHGYLITRGDASWFCDVPVREDQLLGVVTGLYEDGQWRLPGPPLPLTGLRAALAWLSHRSIVVALGISEHLASLVARGGSSVASWGGGRG